MAQQLAHRIQLPEPTLLDRAISYVSPRWALRRLKARAGAAIAYSYLGQNGAKASGYTGARIDKRSMKKWAPGVGSPNTDILPDLATLRARSRDLIRNSPFAGGAQETTVTNVIGTGLRLQPKINREILDLSEEEADAWERRAREIWRAWAERESCDFTRTQNFAGLQDLAFRTVLGTGDILAIRRFRERPGDMLGFKVQLIEGDRISNPNWMLDTPTLAGGVEIDRDGAPIAYHVMNQHPGEYYSVIGRVPEWARVPAYGKATTDRIALLLYRRERPGQVRGVPFLAPVIEPLKQLERYTEAELMAAVIGAMFTVFIKAEAGGLGLTDMGTDADQAAAESDEIHLDYGAIVDLMPGEDIAVANPQRPNQQFDPFVLAVLRQVGVSLGLGYELLIKQFQNSYSASRAALLEAWKFFRARRQWVATSFCQPCYEWVISEALLRGMIEAPGFDDPVIRHAWLRAEWIGPAPGQINPKDEIEAATGRVNLGVSTIEKETAEISGSDWEELHEQRKKERRMRHEAGLESSEIEEGIALPRPERDRSPDERDRDEELGDREGEEMEEEVAI